MGHRRVDLYLFGIIFLALHRPDIATLRTGIPWPYRNSAHYWPMDHQVGLLDMKTNMTGNHNGKANQIHFQGPGNGVLYVNKSVRIVLGTFWDQCVVDPSKCSTPLTVSLWIRYSRRKNENMSSKQFIAGTEAGFRTPGFSIHHVPHQKSQERFIVKVNNGGTVWAGSLNVTSDKWTQMSFTWTNTTGLKLYKNCKNVTGYLAGQAIPWGVGMGKTAPKDHNLYLSKAPGQGRGASRISYDDVAVWYSDLVEDHFILLCSDKVDAPNMQSGCTAGSSWLKVSWVPPSAMYDHVTGYNVWYQYPDTPWEKSFAALPARMRNITSLKPASVVNLRVQNKLLNSYGRISEIVTCKTTKIQTPMPVNVAITATSSRALFVEWDTQKNRKEPLGFLVMYKTYDTDDFIKLDVGPLRHYLISDLSMNTRYDIRLVAYGGKDYKDSSPVDITASTDKDDMRSVLSVSINLISPSALNVSWSPPLDPYAKYWYRVFMQWTQGDRSMMSEIYAGNRSTCVARREQIPFPHTISVMAFVGEVVPPRPIQGPVMNALVSYVTWESSIITWSPPAGFAGKYMIDKYIVTLRSGGVRQSYTTLQTRLKVVGMEQLTTYLMNVLAVNRAGMSPALVEDIEFVTKDRDECADRSAATCDDPDAVVFNQKNCHGSFTRCHGTATCVNTKGSYYCKCGPGFVGNGFLCRVESPGLSDKDFCGPITTQNIKWSRTLKGQTDVTSCPKDVTGVARRKCKEQEPDQDASWDTPDLSECISEWALNIKEQALDPSEAVTSVASKVANLTSVTRVEDIYPGDLYAVVDILGLLSERAGSSRSSVPQASTDFNKAVVQTASNILEAKTINKWSFIPPTKRKRQAGSLMSNLDNVALKMAQSSGSAITAMPNVVLGVRLVINETAPEGIGFREKSTDGSDEHTGNMVMFPSSELSKGKEPQVATYVSYNRLGELLTSGESERNMTINSAVLSLTLTPLKRKRFKEPVTIILSHVKANRGFGKPSCVFWNMSRLPGFWSNKGCYVNGTNSTHTICKCYHLTGFAILMNVKGDMDAILKGDHRLALSLITYIGIVLSVVTLCIALLTFITFRFLKSSRTFLHKNLSISLILAQLLFLFGVNKTEIKLVCQIIAALLHYLWLASFAWMALEGVMLYLMLVKVFGTKTITNKKRAVFLTFGWGLPAVVVGVSAGIFPQGYSTQYYCWLSMERGFIWSFVGPALGVIAFNFVFMGIAFSVMSKRGGKQRKPSKIRKIRYWAKACTLLTCILGLTWLFGVFYVNSETLFMAYFFTIFNSLQGVFIFLFHCVGDEKVRHEYIRVLCCREKGPVYTSTSKSSKSDSTAKMIKSSETNDSNGIKNMKFIDASAGSSSDGRPVLVMFQRRGQRGSSSRDDDVVSGHSSQRMSGEMNPRDSLASFTSFHQNRNSARYSLVSSEMSDPLVRLQSGTAGLSAVEELPSTTDA